MFERGAGISPKETTEPFIVPESWTFHQMKNGPSWSDGNLFSERILVYKRLIHKSLAKVPCGLDSMHADVSNFLQLEFVSAMHTHCHLRKQVVMPHANKSTPRNYYLEHWQCGDNGNIHRKLMYRAYATLLARWIMHPGHPSRTESEELHFDFYCK